MIEDLDYLKNESDCFIRMKDARMQLAKGGAPGNVIADLDDWLFNLAIKIASDSISAIESMIKVKR